VRKKKVIELYHGAKVFTLRDKNKKFKIKKKHLRLFPFLFEEKSIVDTVKTPPTMNLL
jgi:hypothetical protein